MAVAAGVAKKAYILERPAARDPHRGEIWTEEAILEPDKDDMGDFGADVAVDGNVVAVFSPSEYVYLYGNGGGGNWPLIRRIERHNCSFIGGVALDGDTLAISTSCGFQIHQQNQGGADMWGLVREGPLPKGASAWAQQGAWICWVGH